MNFIPFLLAALPLGPQLVPESGGATAVEAERPAISYASIPNDAVVLAVADIQAVPHSAQCWTRFVWTRNGDAKRVGAVKMAAQSAVARTRRVVPIRTVADGRLVCLDLYELAGKDAKVAAELAKLWDRLAERDELFYFAIDDEWVKEKITPYRASDGKTYDWRWAKRDKLLGFGPHIYAEFAGQIESPETPFYQPLIDATGTRTPIVDYQHFCSQVLSTLDEGLYYEFADIKASPDKNLTDFEFWLKDQFGADIKEVRRLQVERKAAHFTSGVTGGPRGVRVVRGLAGWVVWTEDLKRGNVDPNADPTESVENPKGFDAIEAIGVNQRGQFVTAIFNGEGELAEVVPPDVATDFTIPNGFGQELAPWLSCAKCHAAAEGFQSTANPLYDALSKTDGDILAKDPQEAERLAALVQPIEQQIIQAKSDLADGVFLATGGYRFSEMADELRKIENDYRYARVDPVRACRELGYEVPDAKTAVDLLQTVLPSVEGEREAVDVLALKSGQSIAVRKWRAVYGSASYRVRKAGR